MAIKKKVLNKAPTKVKVVKKKKTPPTVEFSPAMKKLRAIMKRNSLSQDRVAQILEVSQGSISGWLRNLTGGRIHKKYFDKLKSAGYL